MKIIRLAILATFSFALVPAFADRLAVGDRVISYEFIGGSEPVFEIRTVANRDREGNLQLDKVGAETIVRKSDQVVSIRSLSSENACVLDGSIALCSCSFFQRDSVDYAVVAALSGAQQKALVQGLKLPISPKLADELARGHGIPNVVAIAISQASTMMRPEAWSDLLDTHFDQGPHLVAFDSILSDLRPQPIGVSAGTCFQPQITAERKVMVQR